MKTLPAPGAASPLYTTYAATINRSRLYGDKAYKMDYYSPDEPLNFSSDHAGRIFTAWRVNSVVVDKMSKYYSAPVVLLADQRTYRPGYAPELVCALAADPALFRAQSHAPG